MNTAWLGTWWGHLLVQVAVGAASITIQGISGHDFGQYNALIQAGAALSAEGLSMLKKSGAVSVIALLAMVTVAASLGLSPRAFAAQDSDWPAPSKSAKGAAAGQPNILTALGGAFQDLADFINSDFTGAANLATAIPSLQDGNGKACWTAMQSFGAIVKAHPVPATLKVATDLEALRLTVMAANQLCSNAACTQVFNEAGNAVATMGIGVPIPKLSDLCAKVPQVAVVPPVATPATAITPAP